MKRIATYLLLFCGLTCKGQNIELHLFIHDPCSNSISNASYYRLTTCDFTNYYESDSLGNCVVLDTGCYHLMVFDRIIQGKQTYHFDSFGEYSDTVRINTVHECYDAKSALSSSGYCCCNKICDGHIIEFYENGTKMLEGKFHNGQPIIIKYYYPSGRVQMIQRYGQFIKKIKTKIYTEGGELINK